MAEDEKAPGLGKDWEEKAKKQDEIFVFDKALDDLLNQEKPWDKDPRHFKKCNVSAIAAAKMLKHAVRGVKKGMEKGGMSVEVMGLLVGKVVFDQYYIMDVIELPVEGAENTVVAGDPETMVYMTRVVDRLEKLRDERLIGWYHSHPFKYTPHQSHCYFSNIDIQNQLSWQMAYKKFVGIVIDPERSLKRGVVECRSFMAYKADYAPPPNECPDGSVIAEKEKRLARWGTGYNRYYMLETNFFTGSLAGHLLDIMVQDHLWIKRIASCGPMEPDSIAQLPDEIKSVAAKLGESEGWNYSSNTKQKPKVDGPLNKAKNLCNDMATRLQIAQVEQQTRDKLFNNPEM